MNKKDLATQNQELEMRRLRAWELRQQGWAQNRIAEALGVTPGAVSQWLKRARETGIESLRSRKGGGPNTRLTAEQIRQIPILMARGPEAYGLAAGEWTRNRIIAMLRQVYGVKFSHGHMGRILKQCGIQLRPAPIRVRDRLRMQAQANRQAI